MTGQTPNVEAALDGLDQNKRRTLKRLIGGGAFARSLRRSRCRGCLFDRQMRKRRQVPIQARLQTSALSEALFGSARIRAAAAFTASSISGATWSMSERSHRTRWSMPPTLWLPDPAASWRSIMARWE